MGKYVNPDNKAFERIVKTGKYVDKTGMIEFTNNIINDIRPLICFSRPRRFGKSIAAHMLVAYYSKGCDSRDIFSKLRVAESPTFEDELNKNTVIYLDMQEMRSIAKSENNSAEVVSYMQTEIISELRITFPDILDKNEKVLSRALGTIFQNFSGAGGFSLGFQFAGYEIIGAVELDNWASETFKINHREAKLFMPKVVVMENVPNIIKAKTASGEKVIDIIQVELERIG